MSDEPLPHQVLDGDRLRELFAQVDANIDPAVPGTRGRCEHAGMRTKRRCVRPPHSGDDHRY